MEIFLESERCLLRYFKPEDKEFLRDLDSDPDVVKYISNGIISDEKEVARGTQIMLSWVEKTQGKYGFWIARLKATQEEIGWFHLRPLKSDLDNFKELELGYRLKKSFWGKGYATELSEVLHDYCFDECHADTLWAHAMKANLASQNIMQKIGMSFDRDEIYDDFPGEDKRCVWFKKLNPNQ